MGFKNTRVNPSDKKEEPIEITDVTELPSDNHWLPASVVAYQFKVSTQTIRNLFHTGQIRAFRFPVGTVLYSAEEVELARDV